MSEPLTQTEKRLMMHLVMNGNEHGKVLCRCGARFDDLNALLMHAMFRTEDHQIHDNPPPHSANRDDPTTDALVREDIRKNGR